MAVTGVSNVSATIEKVVSSLVTKTLIQNSVALAMPGVWDRSGEIRAGMDRLDMIELAELAEQTVDETGAAMTPQTISPTAAELDLDQHKSIPFSLTKRGELQSKIALVSRTVENGARTLAYGVDDYIFTVAVAAAGTTNTTAAADGLEAIRDLAKQFDLDNVPKQGRAAVVSPGFLHDDLLATSSVIKANEFGSAEPVRMGSVASIYGIQIFESSSSAIADDGFLAMGLEAMAFARQRSVEFESQIQVLNQKTDYTLTHLFGAESTAASNPRIYVYNPA